MLSRGFTLWLTGPPGAVKTTIAQLTADELKRRGYKVETLDDEISGAILSSSSGNSQGDEDAGMRRIESVSQSLARNEVIVVAVFNAPNGDAPDDLRRQLQPLVEVEIKGPDDGADQQRRLPEIIVQADLETPQQWVAQILSKLEDLKWIGRLTPQDEPYDADDEEVIRRRLESLGYL